MATMSNLYDSIDELNTDIAACKQAIRDLMLGKSTEFNGRRWQAENLDQLRAHLTFLAKEKAKIAGHSASVAVVARPAR
jgi:hypothetical protein